MKKGLIEFGKNVKSYIDFIMGVGFGDLARHFFSLIIIVFISLIIYIPIGSVHDLIISLVGGISGNVPQYVYTIIALLFELLSLFLSIVFFIYMFNKRYSEVYVNEIENKDKKKFNVPDKIKKEDKNNVGLPEEIDLPKKK